MNLSIANVFTVSVSQPGAQIGEYNTSNLAIVSHEQAAASFGADVYKLYLEPTEVGVDFGTDSITYKMALAVFSQSPNILGPGGYLAILKTSSAEQSVSFGNTPISGGFELNYDGNASVQIDFDDSATIIQAKLRAVAGLEAAIVTGDIPSGLVIKPEIFGAVALLTVTSNTLEDVSTDPVVVSITSDVAGETYLQAITRTASLIEYFGVMPTAILSEVDLLEAAALIQTLNKLSFNVSNIPADVEVGGKLDLLRTGSLNQTRGLYYGGTALAALLFQAAYASRGLSVDFAGNDTTITMHLKDLATIQPDSTMGQTLKNKCEASGADVYANIGSVPKVLCSGANLFFDRIYNLLWIVGAFKVAGFNLYASTPTKIPQTDDGALQLTSVLREVCEAGVTNGFLAPGKWDSPVQFGNPADLLQNVQQLGYYLYSAPVSKQLTAARLARQAPIHQVALKEAGANHSASLIINVNA